MSAEHPLWLPAGATSGLRGRAARIVGAGLLFDTVRAEARGAGMRLVDDETADVVVAEDATWPVPLPARDLDPEGYVLARADGRAVVVAGGPRGALYGWFALVRATAVGAPDGSVREEPGQPLRLLDHWDNVDVDPHMGQVERGYADGSLFYEDGAVRTDLSRVGRYGRVLAAIGINAVTVNNVNVHAREARLLTDDLGEVARIADELRPWGIRTHLSVSWDSPALLGGLATSDPFDARVAAWWRGAADRVYARIPDFGGFLVKADSEGQPGPHAYGRTHADGANVLAAALAPHGGLLRWRAFVYDHRQDWRDRSTDRARAAYDVFVPLDGAFADNVLLQVKHGPYDFQVREPVSPTIPAMARTRLALELQITQEYSGQQQHAVYLAEQWADIFGFRPWGESGPRLTRTLGDHRAQGGAIVAVSNVGADALWTGHPLAQANLYAFGRLAWDSALAPGDVLDEWIALTFGRGPELRAGIHAILDGSWRTYESYTAPLGVGFMVSPLHRHYGPDVDGYEYSPWGTYHFADRDGIGVDRTVATGTGYAGQYPSPWSAVYESVETVPDELILFFHHVPYTHRLHDGSTVIQHIYDTHFAGPERVARMQEAWEVLAGRVPDDVHARGRERFAEQLRSSREWRDQINTYFWRKSGIPDAHGRTIF